MHCSLVVCGIAVVVLTLIVPGPARMEGARLGEHPVIETFGLESSTHPFELYLYAAVNHEESYDWYDPDFNPAYHSTGDRVSLIHEGFMVGNTQIAVAAVATLARLSTTIAKETTSFSRFKARFTGN